MDLFTKPPFNATQYIMEREGFINDELSEPYINQLKARFDNASEVDKLKMLGIKGKKNPKVLAVDTKPKHEEADLQAAFCTWVKKTYPNVKFLRHERERNRGNFAQQQMKVMNSAGAMPDWESTHATPVYAGLLIEFKKPGEKWLLKDEITVKPEYVFQYHCHVGLWKQRRVVYFCNDLAIAKMILQQYLEGRTMRQRVYKFPVGYEYLAEIV